MTGPSTSANLTTRRYSAYGELSGVSGGSRTAYAGQVVEASVGWYLLGNRPYSTLLRRFLAPDPLSPFGEGGLNRHAYCNGDPINHIDPSGHAKRPWKIKRLEGVSASTPARAPVAEAPGTSRTPGMAHATDAATMSASVASAAIPSGSRQPPPVPGHVVVGLLAPGTNSTSGDVAMPPPKKIRLNTAQSSAASSAPSQRLGRRVDILSSDAIPDHRFGVDTATGRGRALKQSWLSRSPPDAPGVSLWVADTMITGSLMPSLFNLARSEGIGKLTLYSGAHGRVDGENWDIRTGRRLYTDSLQLADDRTDAAALSRRYGIQVNVVDVGALTRSEMKSHLSKNGVHVLACCFSAADELVMEILGVRHVTLYDDRVQV